MDKPKTTPAKHETLVLGDDINTDDIIPAQRCTTAAPEDLRHYALEHLIGAETLLQRYDVIEAGRNFGCGSSRENAPIALKAAGIRCVRAQSFGEIFFRNSINIGLSLEQRGSDATDAVIDQIVRAGGLNAYNHQRRRDGGAPPLGTTTQRPQTLAEKLLARASGNQYVRPGETIFARVDLAMSHDAVIGPVAELFHAQFGSDARLWDADKLVLVADHFIQVNDIRDDPRALALHRALQSFAAAQGCRVYDTVAPGDAAGICHVLLPEEGLVHPGMIIAGTDSHTCTLGAFGSFALGVGTTDMANLFAMGDIWLRVPPTVLIHLDGTLPADCCAKDIILHILGVIGCDGAAGSVIEFRGAALDSLDVDERMTLANMSAECGAVCGIIAADERTRSYVGARCSTPWEEDVADSDAEYATTLHFDLSDLTPQVAQPPKPDCVTAVGALGTVAITKAFIGSCTGGKLSDLRQAAMVLRGRKVAAGVELFVVPASQAVRREAQRLGYLDIFASAGAEVLKSACGACMNAGRGNLGRNEVGIYASNRNFKGRNGDPSGRAYLASPRTVAISAVRGVIADRFEAPEA